MDGNRARRLKVGSPLGRLVDEGGDTITMAHYSVLCAYGWQLQNPIFELLFLALNFVFFAMEMRFKITGSLVMAIGEMGPVELEFAFSLALILQGIFGNDYLLMTVGESLGIPSGSACPLHAAVDVYWRTILGCFLFLM